MIDFIEYVVAELKSKRLSKTDAVALVKQFAARSSSSSAESIIHPLLHRNTSDLSEQRYQSTFTGGEFFLTDHQVSVGGDAARRVLPGVAYLEMARAAIEDALPVRPESTVLELSNIAWAHPIVVDERKTISIALIPSDGDEIDFEIYSEDAEQEVIHCQGRATVSRLAPPAALDPELLKQKLEAGQLDPAGVYAAYSRMGLIYGPAFQGIASLHRGIGEVFAQVRLPKTAESTSEKFILHPSVLDSALQASLGLIEEDWSELANEPRLPFALDMLRLISPCGGDMVALLRYSAGSGPNDKVVKVDIDLCDERGNVCVQMHGFSSRVLRKQVIAAAPRSDVAGVEAQSEKAEEPAPAMAVEAGGLPEKTQDYLRKQLSGLLKVPSHKIDARAALENYGIDSMLAMKLTSQLEQTFGSLPKTLFFEYQTIRELADYFVANHSMRLTSLLAPNANRDSHAVSSPVTASPAAPAKRRASRRSRRARSAAPRAAAADDPIAIIGLSGRYPEAIDVDAYWQNLREGKDCITEVPRERWDWREYFSEDRSKSGHHYSKWGGFIAGVDEFDPLFFNMSPLEAELVEPQERLFLQHAWMAIEDAGYTRAGLQVQDAQDLPGQVGVYAGMMYIEYQLFGAEASARGKRQGVAGSPASIANRVSYFLNLHGPSMTLDTMCSSSLTAIHIACQDLKLGRIGLAIAGGVNVTIHPNKYLVLSGGQFISSDGHCQSFGEGGDGYIPGEGVGVVVLKRLSEAQRDGDNIYGVIRGSAVNHGGKTNGYTVPNPQAQSSVISRALVDSGIDARQISYIEAHGTGTKLGDPIEIAALSKAFQRDTTDTGFCLIGSAKSNIGHCESAAGIAGLTKVLLQMQHGQIVPSLHSAKLNPNIDFASTPFIVNQTLRSWERPVVDGRTLPRIAGISSFGAGGSNAHMIVEEYPQPVQETAAPSTVVVLLSARTPEQLQEKARDLLGFVRSRQSAIDLAAMAYTLQVGREPMQERLGLMVSSIEELAVKLEAYVSGAQEIEDAYQGRVKRNDEALSLFTDDADLQQTIDKWIANKRLSKLLDLWVKGLELDWSKLYGEIKPRRVSLPTYPFARERYWIDAATDTSAVATRATPAVLHPLVHSNTSDLSEQRYRSTFMGDEFFLADHQVSVNGRIAQKVLPGVAYLEMARAAIERALPEQAEPVALELRNVVWAEPVVVAGEKQVSIALAARDEEIEYEIYSHGEGREIVHCQGRAIVSEQPAPAAIDLEQLAAHMTQGRLEPDGVYSMCARMGLVYGPAFRGITAIQRGSGQALARLRLPKSVERTSHDYVLHPSLMDSALQACVGLMEGSSEVAGQPRLPFALESLRIVSGCTAEMAAWVRYSPGSQATDHVVKVDVDLCDERGNVCVQMRGLSSRILSDSAIVATAGPIEPIGSLLATPVWEPGSIEAPAGASECPFAEYRVLVCELPQIDRAALESVIPQSRCLSLRSEQQETIAQRYCDAALSCFEQVQEILRGKTDGRTFVQIVVADDDERALFAGLSGLLKTASMENPRFAGQIILVPSSTTTEELGERLQAERLHPMDAIVRYEQKERTVLRWREVPAAVGDSPIAFQDRGVYLITGGLGGLGLLFAQEILERTSGARVVLTGRSELTGERRALLDRLSAEPGRVAYRAVDLGDREQVEQLMTAVRNDYDRLDGILHCAGMIADRFILRKASSEFREVLTPKVIGTFNLDQASRDMELDFFVLFSSLAGAMGNLGQADYATANAFMDRFATHRNRQVAAGTRHGRTRSINWPLWEAGGMGIDPASRELLQQTTGMQPMQTTVGLDAFHRGLALPHDQILIGEGDLAQMRRALAAGRPVPPVSPEPAVPPSSPSIETAAVRSSSDNLLEQTQDYLRRQFADLLKLPAHKIDPHAVLENYGIDSILAMRLTNRLEETFGSLSKTLFFEYQTISGLAGYFVKAHPGLLREALGLHETPAAKEAASTAVDKPRPAPARRSRGRVFASKASASRDIAIVGLAGRYPQADNLEEFWRNLREGRDCITEIPAERWDHELYYDPDPDKVGKSYSKWGGFVADVDKFDPLFFRISPKEAALIDPQERLFLETAWQTIEDAGYTKESIAGSRMGVYVGAMWAQYELFGAESLATGEPVIPTSSHASIANRVSYFFDLHGPSIALDTMCSSSLTAIHLACEAIRRGEIDAAIAGGVNVTIHPYKYLSLSQGKFAASDGRCRSFGEGGDGYVPGEGVGAVLLKPLDDALRDGDQIYAVVKSSSVNHGGKTNGYTVPNPNAQAELILEAVKKAKIDPGTLSYVETHGTGTSLGDPIEITGLSKAFEGFNVGKRFCPIGSVKSNIGHLESAAGIAAVTKSLLQIRHNELVPSLHAHPVNPNIDFDNSPFYVQTELAEWTRPAAYPRRVGVSSFGAGGSNAHVVLEEYVDTRVASAVTSPEVFVLSAKSADALCRYAEKVVELLGHRRDVSLADLAFTSQVGRTQMPARLAVIAASADDLERKLRDWIRSGATGGDIENVFHGDVKKAQYNAHDLIEGPAGKAFLADLLASRDLEKIARLWILGVDIDWSLMQRAARPRRVSLPTYPFERERHWIQQRPMTRVDRVVPERMEEPQRTYYSSRWTPKHLSGAKGDAAIGPILIVDETDRLFLSMRELVKSRPVVWVRPGGSFEEIERDVYVVDPAKEEHFQELVASIERKALFPGVVVHHSPDPCNLEVEHDVSRELNHGVYTLLSLCKALLHRKEQSPPRIISVFSSDSESTAPLGAAIGGFFKAIALEDPRFLAKAVELQSGEELSSPRKAALILDEILDEAWTAQEIRYRGTARSVRELSPFIPAKAAALPVKRNGVYLITGGAGGLGSIFAEYLAKNFQARLVLIGRSAPDTSRQEKLRQLERYGAEILCLQADVSRMADMSAAVREAKARFSTIDGVIHAAGVNRDAFVLKKTKEQMETVLAPKVHGAVNVDRATRGENLDFFVLFSSLAGVLGNVGQSDYAYGNRFLDSFAEYRERLRAAQQRSGRTLSIDWPLWEEGGMGIAPADVARLTARTGISPLPTQEGIQYWEDFLRSDTTQAVALYGIPSRIAASLAGEPARARRNSPAPVQSRDSATLIAAAESYLKTLIGKEINLAPDRIGASDSLESFGIDSITINRINAELERDFGALPKTLLYEHETVSDLAKFLVKEAREALTALSGAESSAIEPVVVPARRDEGVARGEPSPAHQPDDLEEIAIIGTHGYYPRSANLAEYWDHLKQGRDLIDVVPPQRWDYEELYHPDPAAAADGKIYCKWGGFLADYDKFDPHFFKISTSEAKLIDPQERLFLESVWAAIEDAGYTRESMRARFPKTGSADVGVFVGVTTNSYHLWAPEERSRGNFVTPSAMPWSIANRVSYFFDFNGPSMPVDTACSSSLVAIHLACESLRRRECQVAIAGGVNLYLHPAKYHSLCQRRALSRDGRTYSYGAGDDGFVPGEAVGTVVLKPLRRAIEDGDHIHAVIRASAFDHSGRSNGYSAPNPNAQASLISRVLDKAGIHPETIGYIEGHGTGTQLGDSLEIAALTQAFNRQTTRKQFCPIGSVKANVGHSESAAGIAGLAKVIAQMQHRQLAPSIYSNDPNPNIEFGDSPFYLQHELSAWESSPDHPRRALINSFGAGGVNACAIVEECERRSSADVPMPGPHLFTLSARDKGRLREYVDRLLNHLRQEPSVDLANLCYTLQVGREAMEERLAMVVADAHELIHRLEDWKRGAAESVHRGSLDPRRGSRRASRSARVTMGEQSLSEIASRWVAGEVIDWSSLYSAGTPRRISAPTYPFARERYWVSDSPVPEKAASSGSRLHPLIACNSSTLKEVNFSSSLSDGAFYAVDHQVHDERIFPGAGFLEIACISGNIAGERRVRRISDVVWMRPLSFRGGAQTVRTVLREVQGGAEYEISSFDDDNEIVVHSEGKLAFWNGRPNGSHDDAPLSVKALEEQCTRREDGTAFYEKFAEYGLNYGPAFQTVQELHVGDSFALAKLRIADHLKSEFGQFLLHPAIIDGALQTVAGLAGKVEPRTPYLPFALDEVEIVRPLSQTCYAYAEHAGTPAQDRSGVAKFNIRLLNERGDLLVRLRNLYVRPLVGLVTKRQSLVAETAGRGRLLSMSGEPVD